MAYFSWSKRERKTVLISCLTVLRDSNLDLSIKGIYFAYLMFLSINSFKYCKVCNIIRLYCTSSTSKVWFYLKAFKKASPDVSLKLLWDRFNSTKDLFTYTINAIYLPPSSPIWLRDKLSSLSEPLILWINPFAILRVPLFEILLHDRLRVLSF